jgi:hypothetical protein
MYRYRRAGIGVVLLIVGMGLRPRGSQRAVRHRQTLTKPNGEAHPSIGMPLVAASRTSSSDVTSWHDTT